MGSDGNLGLLLSIDLDATQARMDAAALGQQVSQSLDRAADSAEGLNKSLLNQHQTVHLLAEEMGIHLPRAVVSGVSEMLPNVEMLGGALLGVFAVKEAYDFFEWTKKAVQEAAGLAAAEKAMADAAKENLKDFANLSRQQLQMEIMRANVRLASQEETFQHLRSVMEKEIALTGPEGILLRKLFGDDKDLAAAKQAVDTTEQLVTGLTKLLNEENQEAASEAKKAAKDETHALEEQEKAYERQYHAYFRAQGELDAFKLKAMAAAAKQMAEDEKARAAAAKTQEDLNRQEIQYMNMIAALTPEEARHDAIVHMLAVHTEAEATAVKHVSQAYKEWRMTVQAAGSVMGNFQAEINAMPSRIDMVSASLDKMAGATIQAGVAAAMSGQSIGKAMEQALKATLTSIASEAAVRALYNVALGFYYLAIQAYPQADLAFDSAAFFGAVAAVTGVAGAAIPGGGRGRSSGAGAGGGYGASASDSGGGGSSNPQTLALSSGGGGSRFNGTAHVVVFGTNEELQNWVAGAVNGAVNRGVSVTATSSQRGAPVGH